MKYWQPRKGLDVVLKREDLLAGALCVLIGMGFALYTLLTLKIGTPSRMGSGFFPLVLGGLLAVLGIAIVIRGAIRTGAITTAEDDVELGPVPWRGIVILALAPVLFALTVRSLGMVLATALCVAVVCFASSRVTMRMAVVVTIGLTTLCVAVFSFGLGVTLPLLPSVMGG